MEQQNVIFTRTAAIAGGIAYILIILIVALNFI